MGTRLYVGNLPYNTTEAELRNLFEQAGTVSSASIIKDRDTGQSKGFAFVEMGSESEAENAMRMFNGYSLNNRELKVNEARPREERGGGGGRRGGGGYSSGRRSEGGRGGGYGGSRDRRNRDDY